MSRHVIPVYATEKDWQGLITAVQSDASIQMVEAGLFVDASTPTVHRMKSHMQYLVFRPGTPIRTRSVPQRRGGEMHAVDQLLNPTTLVISVGGMHEGERLLQGQIGTASGALESLQLFKLFRRRIGEQFEKIQSYFVGPEAVGLLDAGLRLTPTPKSPVEYDLKRNC